MEGHHEGSPSDNILMHPDTFLLHSDIFTKLLRGTVNLFVVDLKITSFATPEKCISVVVTHFVKKRGSLVVYPLVLVAWTTLHHTHRSGTLVGILRCKIVVVECWYAVKPLPPLQCVLTFFLHSISLFLLRIQRCIAIKPDGPITCCPTCSRETTGLALFPMSFLEIDEARKTVAALASTGRRGRKRKNSEGGVEEKGVYVSERRTGRWTCEETAFCDILIDKFSSGQLPIAEGIKLNDFLGSMLKSKQSRLTKKMKNAKLSSKMFDRATGHVVEYNDARVFSQLEDSFFHSIQCHQERAEIKFHMQKEWREMFSNYCAAVGQTLDADAWLSSVEEMDRRASHAKDSARMARRKLMMGFALRLDGMNPESGVFIEKTDIERNNEDPSLGPDSLETTEEDLLSFFAEKSSSEEKQKHSPGSADSAGKNGVLHSAPFLSKAIAYMQRHNVPFEHVDIWVPSFVPTTGDHIAEDSGSTTCRLCYAGSATVDTKVDQEGKCYVPVNEEEAFFLHAFGDYSQKFSFDVGCGLPGRVYHGGLPTWEQSVHNAPHNHFERCGGARNFGIKTVIGIPIASPNVGRIVVCLYSRHDRNKDQELVGRLSEEFSRVSKVLFTIFVKFPPLLLNCVPFFS